MLRAAKPIGEAKRAGSTSKPRKHKPQAGLAAGGDAVVWPIKVFRNSNFIAVVLLVAVLSIVPAHANQDAAKASPRGSVVIGGASVVLIAANDRIYALIDRLDDNAPVADAALSVDLSDGSSLSLSRVSNGLFVAPFNHAGRMEDAFMISLASPDGAGDGAAEIQYADIPPPEAPPVRFDLRATAAVTLTVGAAGALLGGGAMLLARTRRRRAAGSPGGSAAARL